MALLARARFALRQPIHVLQTLLVVALASAAVAAQSPPLPNRPGSLKFAAIGDNGTGERPQYELAKQMTNAHTTKMASQIQGSMFDGTTATTCTGASAARPTS